MCLFRQIGVFLTSCIRLCFKTPGLQHVDAGTRTKSHSSSFKKHMYSKPYVGFKTENVCNIKGKGWIQDFHGQGAAYPRAVLFHGHGGGIIAHKGGMVICRTWEW